MPGANRTVAVALIAKMQSFRSGLGDGVKAAREFGGELEGMRRKSQASLHDVELAAGAAGAALLGLAGWAIKANMEFDRQMSEVQAVSGATADQLDDLRAAALEAGKATVFSATEAAQAEAELAKAGLSTADILGGALSGSLALAAAGTLDLAEAADVSAKAMNTFGLQGSDVAHIADVLAGGANATATDVHELGQALKMGGLAAHGAGMSLDDTVTVLGALADNALIGSDAGTSLKSMLMMLQAPTEKSANLMERLGLNVYDAGGNMVDAYTLAGRLQQALGGLTQQERNAAIATIFGADAMRGANIMVKLGEQGLRDYNQRIMEQADAAATAATKTDNLAGDLERLKGSIETLAIESGEGANGGLRFLAQTLDHMVGSFGELPDEVQAAAVILGGLTGAALLAAVAFSKLRSSTKDALDALASAGPVGSKVVSGVGKVAVAVGKLGVAMTALQLISAVTARNINPQLDAMTQSLTEFAMSGKLASEMSRVFGEDMARIHDVLKMLDSGAWADFGRGAAGFAELFYSEADNSLKNTRVRLEALDSALAQLVKSGNADMAAMAFNRLAEEGEQFGVTADEISAGLPQYAAAMQTGADATTQSATAADQAAQEWDVLSKSFAGAATEAGGLVKVFDELNGRFLAWAEAEIGAEAALDDLQAALKESNGSLNVHDEKGRRARQALLGFAAATRDAMQAKIDESGSIDDANKVYQHYRDELVKTMVQAGLTRKEAGKLADEWLRMPKTVTTTVTTKYVTTGNPPGHAQYRNVTGLADGAIIEAYAAGGMRENHTAQIAPAGAYRMWSEPETGGEAYIPLGASKRGRSTAILAEVNQRFGYPLSGGAPIMVTVPVTLIDPMTGTATRKALIKRAIDAGVPEATVRAAYP